MKKKSLFFLLFVFMASSVFAKKRSVFGLEPGEIVNFHHNRLSILSGRYVAGSYKNMLYDLKTRKIINLPDIRVNGKPVNGKKLFYDGKKLIVQLNGFKMKNILNGKAPVCTDSNTEGRRGRGHCSGRAEYIAKYKRWLCRSCRKYVKVNTYMKLVFWRDAYVYDLKTGKMKKITVNFGDRNEIIGADGKFLYFYYYNFQKTVSVPLILGKLDLKTGKVASSVKFNIPIRKIKTPLMNMKTGKRHFEFRYKEPELRFTHSDDFSKIILWEYDELCSKNGGCLKNPTARGYIIDTVKFSKKDFNIPVTMYGYVFTDKNKYFIMSSNQLGKIYKLNTETAKIEKVKFVAKSIIHISKNQSKKIIYVFDKRKINILTLGAFKKIKTIKWSSFYKGARKLFLSYHGVNGYNGKVVFPYFKKMSKLKGYLHDDKKKIQVFNLISK